MKIDTIIFDLGGVLVDWNPKYIYQKVFETEEKVDWFLKNVCTNEWNLQQDAGRPIAEGVKIKCEEFPDYCTEIKQFYTDWEYMFSGPIEENVALLKRLKASNKYKIVALTNWCSEKWEKALELFPFFKEFDGVLVSGIEKMKKPDAEIYKLLFKRFEIKPQNAIFIDDNFDNIVAAKKLQLNGIFYQNPLQLKQELDKLNVLV